jgi:signal transduction histidine kinase
LKRYEDFLAIEWDATAETMPAPISAGTVDGLQLLERVKSDETLVRSRKAAIEAAIESLHPVFTESTPTPVFEIVIPVPREKSKPLFLVGLTRPGVAMERMLLERGRELPLTVTSGKHMLYRRGEVPELPGEVRASQRPLSVWPGDSWLLTVYPTAAMVNVATWRLSSVTLFAGLVVSLLLATVLTMSQSAWVRSNEFLAEDMERRMGEMELTRVEGQRRQLEAQVSGTQQQIQRLRLEKELLTREARARVRDLAPSQNTGLAELEAFSYSVSHDLRSPLGAIMNYAAVLTEDFGDKLGDDGRDHLARIAASAQTAVSMMDGLLAFSRASRAELKIQPVDMQTIVREIYQELCISEGQRFPNCRPQLTMGNLPPVNGDPTLLRIMLANLLANAFKFTRHVKDPTLEVGGYINGDEVVYYVKDNGIGFDSKSSQKLFNVFERLHSKDEYEGHGIGLALVERIARRHGGSVRAEGVVGKGATFFVTLPNHVKHNSDTNAGVHHVQRD